MLCMYITQLELGVVVVVSTYWVILTKKKITYFHYDTYSLVLFEDG